MKSLTVAFITSRPEPRFEWFIESLLNQLLGSDNLKVLWIDLHQTIIEQKDFTSASGGYVHVEHHPIKPTVWQGVNRLTKEDWWAVSNARNTALCLCSTDYIVWVDDRCVLMPGWLKSVRDAMEGNYSVCGNYEKRHGMIVESGVIVNAGTLDGKDARDDGHGIRNCFNQFWGGTYGMPTEWSLAINGFEEGCDGLGSEDYICGMMLSNNGFVAKYDPALKIVEDRTPSEIGPVMKRTSKERFPNDPLDKGHKAIERFGNLKRCLHHWNLREIREKVLAGDPWPDATEPKADWFDGQPLSEMS